jgi:hypothetical protein
LGRPGRHLDSDSTFDTVCPVGGDQAAWLEARRKIRGLLLGRRGSGPISGPS